MSKDEFYVEAAYIFTDRMNLAHAAAAEQVIKEKTGDQSFDFLACMIASALDGGEVRSHNPQFDRVERLQKGKGHFGYNVRTKDPDEDLKITDPIFYLTPDLRIAADDMTSGGFTKMFGYYVELLRMNHDFLENADNPGMINALDEPMVAGGSEELQFVEPAEHMVNILHNDAMRIVFEEYPDEIKAYVASRLSAALSCLDFIRHQSPREDIVKFTEKWLARIFGPVFYFMPFDMEEVTGTGQTFGEYLGALVDGLDLDYRIDDAFVSSTIFGKDFDPAQPDDFKVRLKAVSESDEVQDRFRKHVAKDLLSLVDKYYGKTEPDNRVRGLDVVKHMFLKNRLGKRYDNSHFWANKDCRTVFLPAITELLGDDKDFTLFWQALRIREKLGIDPNESAYVDVYKLARASSSISLEMHTEAEVPGFAGRLKSFKDAVSRIDITPEERQPVLDAIERIEEMTQVRGRSSVLDFVNSVEKSRAQCNAGGVSV